eukprot:g37687.t1
MPSLASCTTKQAQGLLDQFTAADGAASWLPALRHSGTRPAETQENTAASALASSRSCARSLRRFLGASGHSSSSLSAMAADVLFLYSTKISYTTTPARQYVPDSSGTPDGWWHPRRAGGTPDGLVAPQTGWWHPRQAGDTSDGMVAPRLVGGTPDGAGAYCLARLGCVYKGTRHLPNSTCQTVVAPQTAGGTPDGLVAPQTGLVAPRTGWWHPGRGWRVLLS